MSLAISPLNSITFKANPAKRSNQPTQTKTDSENPISRKGETMNLIKGTFIAGLGIGARLLFELFDGDFLVETAGKQGERLANNARRDVTGSKKTLLALGATGAIIAAGVSGFAILYTMYKAPKIAYDSKVNTFKKSKEMDIYIKSNEAESEIYHQMSEKAKTSNDEEKENLKEQYMKMQMAKNQVPEFVKLKK